ncbi:hypothetical protein PLESTB_001429800 [Pleodorina starrii]|uniref:Uncharacterized protein n=1 Tax=Pleodorina starrii TaxID=330485 RepID=A0A9W6BV41_9CHLO|nr:hypothetical protein PLESTB_001429800 [Pleodorina starrii]
MAAVTVFPARPQFPATPPLEPERLPAPSLPSAVVIDFDLPPLESINFTTSKDAYDKSVTYVKTFINCKTRPPPDCNGHGRLGGICFCICDPGYAPVLKDGHAVSWCVPQQPTNGTEAATGFWAWIETPMGAASTIAICFAIFLASACFCYFCYRRWKRQRAARVGAASGGGGGGDSGGVGKDQVPTQHYNFYAGTPPSPRAMRPLDMGPRDSRFSIGSDASSFFKAWWMRKAAIARQRQQQQQQQQRQQRQHRQEYPPSGGESVISSGGDGGGGDGGRSIAAAAAAATAAPSRRRRDTRAVTLGAGVDASAAMAAQLRILTQQQQQLMTIMQQQQQQHPHHQQQERPWIKSHGASISGSALSGSSRSFVNPLALEHPQFLEAPGTMYGMPQLAGNHNSTSRRYDRYDSRVMGGRERTQRLLLPLGAFNVPPPTLIPTLRYDMYDEIGGGGGAAAGWEQYGWNGDARVPISGGGGGGGGRSGGVRGSRSESLPAWHRPGRAGPVHTARDRRGLRLDSAPAAAAFLERPPPGWDERPSPGRDERPPPGRDERSRFGSISRAVGGNGVGDSAYGGRDGGGGGGRGRSRASAAYGIGYSGLPYDRDTPGRLAAPPAVVAAPPPSPLGPPLPSVRRGTSFRTAALLQHR